MYVVQAVVPRQVSRVLLMLATIALVLASLPLAANADEPDESGKSHDLVLQAISFVVNTPRNREMIAGRIEDALEAPDKSDTDLTKVQQAGQALRAGDLRTTCQLLQEAIGAHGYTGVNAPAPIRETLPAPATGVQTGTHVVVDPLTPNRTPDSGDIAVLTVSGLAVAPGLLMVRRDRHRHTIRLGSDTQTSGKARPVP
ncbi:hypothetical protein ACFV1N_45205 [Streptosporangium canum]|uniref:hypothetical protein n=1 Tax=Streptosporangium canum TaxID=324952 RepID=UPI0036A43030